MFSLIKFLSYVYSIVSYYLVSVSVYMKDFYVVEVFVNYVSSLCKIFKMHINFRFDILMDVSCIDLLGFNGCYYIIYNMLSVQYTSRLFLGTRCRFTEKIKSISFLFNSAEWYEREVYDMFGVVFDNHSDLRRILCDYGFDGYPLRKDFPVSGYVEPYYDISSNVLEFTPVHLPQECRCYEYMSPWPQVGTRY